MNIEVITADYQNPQHGVEIIQLLNAYAQDPMGGGKPLTTEVQQNLIDELAKRPQVFSLIGYANEKAVGLVNCVVGFSTFAGKPLINIHDLAVLKEYRGRGISQKMLHKVEQIAIQKGCCKVTLEVLEGNESAKKAYIKYGFAGYELDPTMGRAMLWQKSIANN